MAISTLDRQTAPAFKEIEKIEILQAQKSELSNGIPVYCINAGTEEAVKIDLIFRAGSYEALSVDFPKSGAALLSSAVNHLIQEGTSVHSSAEIAENIDYYGAFIQTESDKDSASVSLITLNKHLNNTLPWLEEIVKDALFPEKEMTIYLQNARQKFNVDSQKVAVIARRKFNEVIFGNHPYGRNTEPEDFGALKREQLLHFFKKFYVAGNCQIIVSGKIPDELLLLLDARFGNWKGSINIPDPGGNLTYNSSLQKKHFIEREGQLQSAIRVGRPLFSKRHPDYAAMKVLNVVLGGYFGSRLMTNIREDKGYTYGIGSAVFSMVREGCFFISTEVGAPVTANALKEIYFEIGKIRDEKIAGEELQKVRNYMLGEFIRSVDGPFALAERLKGLLLFGLGYDFYDQFIEIVKTVSSSTLQEMAQKYLMQDDLYEVVAGKTA